MIDVRELTDIELIAAVINCSEDIAQELFEYYENDIVTLGNHLSYPNIKGVGKAKTMALQAAFELGKRKAKQEEISNLNATIINNSRAVFATFNHDLSSIDHEELWALYLSKNGKVITKKRISIGGVDYVSADIRMIVKPAIELNASCVALCHNHPHSTTRPSPEDRSLTTATSDALKIFGVRLLDHIIISDGRFYSFNDNGDI